MIHRPRRAVPLVVLVALLGIAPSPASSQLGGLVKKAAKKAVEERVEAALPFTPKEAPEFNDRVLEIDDALVAQLLRGFDAEISYSKDASQEYKDQVAAHEQAMKDYERAREAYDGDNGRWQRCEEEFKAKEAQASEANEARIDKAVEDMNDEELEKLALDLATRGEKLARDLKAGRNDPATQRAWEEYQRDVQILTVEQQRRAMLAMSGAMAEQRRAVTEDPRLTEACGKKPESPTQPQTPLAGPEGILAARGSEAAGLTSEQYAIMRERVIYWWEQGRRPERMGYSEEEIQALEARWDEVNDVLGRMKKAKVPF
jgi:dsDNA-binding SOS-regulon protein